MEYAIKISSGKSSKESLKYILEQKLIEFNVDEWNDTIFGVRNTNINTIISNIYKIFTSKSYNSINKIKKAIQLDSSSYNIKVMKTFNKDFYKNFI